MEQIKVTDLIFKKVPGNDAKSFPCNYCGQVGFTYNWWSTAVRFMAGAEFKIVLCSDECRDKFIENPASQLFLDECIVEMKRVHRLKKKIIVTEDHGSN
jgi:hypothetical protein